MQMFNKKYMVKNKQKHMYEKPNSHSEIKGILNPGDVFQSSSFGNWLKNSDGYFIFRDENIELVEVIK